MQVTISRRFDFSASHRYYREDWSEDKNKEVFGLCTSPYGHGHNYELHVTIRGAIDPQTGMIINLSQLKRLVNEILQQFDHKFLNLDTPYFKNKVPTTENIAVTLFGLIRDKLQSLPDLHLQRLRLYERDDLYADVWEDDESC